MMRDIYRLLAQLVPATRFQEETNSQHDIRAWVSTQAYGIHSPISRDSFTLSPSSWVDVDRALTIESDRFVSGAIETITGIRPDVLLPKSFAWQVIRSYYSAFYAAHALLRLFGFSCTNMPRDFLQKVLEVAQALGQDNGVSRIDQGIYYAIFDPIQSEVRFQRVDDSHADTWGSFVKLIDALRPQVFGTTARVQVQGDTDSFWETLRKCLHHRGSSRGNWLSVVRNDVNYKFDHGAWFPYSGRQTASDFPSRRVGTWLNGQMTLSYANSTPTFTIFFETCSAIVALCKGIFDEVVNRSAFQQFLENGSLHLMRQVQGNLDRDPMLGITAMAEGG